MAKTPIPKTRCSGTLTEAQFTAFIRSNLRRASGRWKPTSDALKAARVAKGLYLCACCQQVVPVTIVDSNGKRIKYVSVDHRIPVVDPEEGLVSWDKFINNLFCEVDNLQLLCKPCHDNKTSSEREIASARKKREKEEGKNPSQGE